MGFPLHVRQSRLVEPESVGQTRCPGRLMDLRDLPIRGYVFGESSLIFFSDSSGLLLQAIHVRRPKRSIRLRLSASCFISFIFLRICLFCIMNLAI
ncbi:hypothetical protein BDW71DRAFT_175157 [Aspergillus fruticulosus]